MNSLTDENWSVFMKTDKTGRSSFVGLPKIDRLNLIFKKI
jgi:hypothetical protein